MKNKIKIALAIVLFVTLLSGSVVLAYYVKEHTDTINQSIDITNETIIEISSFQELIDNGTSSEYNDYNKVSNSSTRKILKLNKDITLTDSVILTKDIHLDLNGKTLNLNDHELSFKHGYSGCFMLYNGTIQAGENALGKIIIDLPNAGYKVNGLTYKKIDNNTTSTEAEIIKVVNLNPIYTTYSAFYLAANSFASDLDSRPEFKAYEEILELTTFTPELFITKKPCSYHSDTLEACSFVYKDLDLIDYYLATDIEISYSSDNENIINSYGELGGTFGDVNFTITITKEGWTNSYTCTFLFHVVDLSQTEVRQNVGLALIKAYLKDYYVAGNLVIKEEVVLRDYYYKFDHAINLPKTALGVYNIKEDGTKELMNAITYSYSTTDIKNVERNSSIILEENSNAYVFSPSISDNHLVVTIDGKATSLNMYSTYVNLEESIAYKIVNHLYGGSIIYDKSTSGKNLIPYSEITEETYPDLKPDLDLYGVTNITYSIKADSEVSKDYELNNNVLSIKSGSLPSDKEGFITMSVWFGENHYDIDLYVEYFDANATTLSSYLKYYSTYNALVPSELETYFTLPFCTNNLAPYTCYDVALYETEEVTIDGNLYTRINASLFKPDNLKIELWYDGESQLVFNKYDSNDPKSFTEQLDAHLTANSLTLQALAAKDKGAEYRFSIDAQNSLTVNTKLVILYNYKFNANEVWARYENKLQEQAKLTDNNTTFLTVLGGLFYNENGKNGSDLAVDNAVVSSDFFAWIYNKFRPNIEGYSNITSATKDRIIPIDWLGQLATITIDDEALKNVTNFSGIKYLTGITEADLSGSTISENVLTAISEMKSIKSLNLSDCRLTSVTSLSNLSKYNTLKYLDISSNSIEYFESISAITSLEKVYLYGNHVDNDYYGSKGICNFQTFADLMMNGCSVYNDTSNNVPVLYAESNNLDDYRRLKEIAYQATLKEGSDITELYSQFAALGTTVVNVTGDARPGNNPFGLQTAGTLAWGYEGDNTETEGAKYHVATVVGNEAIPANTYYELIDGTYTLTQDATFDETKTYYVQADSSNAKYFYVTLTYSSGGYVLKVKYYVDRF